MVSAVVLTKNEENNILQCINSLDWCNEIIIIDDYSSDNTIDKIQKLKSNKVKIYKKHLENDFSSQRNYGLSKAKFDWVLFIDADEKVTDSLQYEIINSINSSLDNISGFYFKRKDLIWGKLLNFGEYNRVKLLRLARKNFGRWHGKVHEKWKINGKTATLNNPLIHTPHQSLSNFLEEINYYTDLRAVELFQEGKKADLIAIFFYPILKFIQNYFIEMGIFDGIQGLISAIVMSFHSFLVRGKLWKLWEERKK